MVPFTLKILQNFGDKSFMVEYKPTDETLSTYTQHIHLEISSNTTKEQVVEMLKGMSPQPAWEQQLAAKEENLSHLDDLVDTPIEVIDLPQQTTATQTVTSDATHEPTAEEIRLYQEVQMEAAVQRVLSRLAGERI